MKKLKETLSLSKLVPQQTPKESSMLLPLPGAAHLKLPLMKKHYGISSPPCHTETSSTAGGEQSYYHTWRWLSADWEGGTMPSPLGMRRWIFAPTLATTSLSMAFASRSS